MALLTVVAEANRWDAVYTADLGWLTLFAYDRDLDAVELLGASLLAQATGAAWRSAAVDAAFPNRERRSAQTSNPMGLDCGSGRRRIARVLLDSTVLIDALRGRRAADRVRRLRRDGDEPWVCAISVEEIWRGALTGEAAIVRRLFRGLRCAPLGVAEGDRAGHWRRELAAAGVTVRQADCLIASAAVSIGARLATGTPDDFPMAGVTVDHWPVGS